MLQNSIQGYSQARYGRQMPLTQLEAEVVPRPGTYVERFNETQMKTRYVKPTTSITHTLSFAGTSHHNGRTDAEYVSLS
jgi:hypothetical protein